MASKWWTFVSDDERAPGCPADLDTTSKAHWRKIKAHIEKRGDWVPVYAHILELLVRAMERGRLARKDLVDEKGRPCFTAIGSQGQVVQHPSVKTAREAERDVLEYLRALRLTPQELAKAGGDVGKPPTSGKFGSRFG